MNLKEIVEALEASKNTTLRRLTSRHASVFAEAEFNLLDPDDIRELGLALRLLAQHQRLIGDACGALGYTLRVLSQTDDQIDATPALAYLYGKGHLLSVAEETSNVTSGILADMGTALKTFGDELESETS